MGESTTIRVSVETRERLKELARRRGASAGELVAALVDSADEQRLLDEAEAAFGELARDPDALAAYRSEAREIEAGFDTATPDW